MSTDNWKKSDKLNGVCYDIRGPVLAEARRMEEDGQKILKLNLGNPAPFDFDVPDEIRQDVIRNLPNASGYCDAKGLFPARKAVVHYYQTKNIHTVDVEDIYIGNGVSELIVMAMQALLNNGDEVLIPAPDYPLWTAAVRLAGGKPMHYICDEQQDWQPDINDIKSKITSKTKALVIINPNNPTGALYENSLLKEMIELARQHKLIIYSDEIYDKILYDGNTHTPTAALCNDVLCVTFNGLSKAYRAAGYRSGWMMISGPKHQAKSYLEGLEMLSSMRLCANVPSQYAIQTALGGYQSIEDLIVPTGRLGKQRDLAYNLLTAIPGLSCVKPKAAMYLFLKLDPAMYSIADDERFAFNWIDTNHFRIVFLPHPEDLHSAAQRIERFLARRRATAK